MSIFQKIASFFQKEIPDHPLYLQIKDMKKVRTPNLIYNLLKMEGVELDSNFKWLLLHAEREEMKIQPEQVRPILKKLHEGWNVRRVALQLCDESEIYIL